MQASHNTVLLYRLHLSYSCCAQPSSSGSDSERLRTLCATQTLATAYGQVGDRFVSKQLYLDLCTSEVHVCCVC
jgi:hypothetical protein